MTKVAIYVRVSTKDQTYEQQIKPCLNFCEMKGWTEVDIFKEVESSVKLRPVLQDLFQKAKSGKYQVIVVWRIDRAWRSSRQFIMDHDWMKSRGIKIVSVMEGFDPTTPIGEAMMTILVVLAQLERDNISQATRQRLKILKENGKHIGRPYGSKDTIKRKNEGYKQRWARLRGTKKEYKYTPDNITLKKPID